MLDKQTRQRGLPGVDPDVRNLYGWTVVHYALIYVDRPEIVHTLASQGVPIDHKDNSYDGPPCLRPSIWFVCISERTA